MARVTIEDCLKRIPNRFLLVHVTTKRVRQLNEGSPRLIQYSENEDVVTALREIAAGKVFLREEETEGDTASH
ncbi:MAG: DNA-directed RNA polymerase subunit omega [Desulfosalsimonadaceae bacterium]